MWWTRIESNIKNILESESKTVKTKKRSDRELIEEILEISRFNREISPRRSNSGRNSLYKIIEIVAEYESKFQFENKNEAMIWRCTVRGIGKLVNTL